MFDVYMEGHRTDPRARARMMFAMVAALAVTTAAGMGSWAAGRLSIGIVGPPRGFDFTELSVMTEVPIERHAPPDRPKLARNDAHVAAARTTARPQRSRQAESPVGEGPPTETARTTGVGHPDGFDNGEVGNLGPKTQVGCLGPGCVPDGPPISAVPRGPTTPRATSRERAPLSVLKARSVYAPDPSPAALAKTKTGLGSRSSGRVKVDFCVGSDGRVASAKVVGGFAGDPEIDRICRAAVKRWRFKPALVGGKAKTTCSDVTFNIQFE